MRRIALVGLFCLVTLAACGGPNPAASQAYEAFVKQLRAAGATVVEDQESYSGSVFSGEAHHPLRGRAMIGNSRGTHHRDLRRTLSYALVARFLKG